MRNSPPPRRRAQAVECDVAGWLRRGGIMLGPILGTDLYREVFVMPSRLVPRPA